MESERRYRPCRHPVNRNRHCGRAASRSPTSTDYIRPSSLGSPVSTLNTKKIGSPGCVYKPWMAWHRKRCGPISSSLFNSIIYNGRMRCVLMTSFGKCVCTHRHKIDPNSFFCFKLNKGAPIAFSILYGISAVTHWYQCWYVHTVSIYIALVVFARLGLMLCALPVRTYDDAQDLSLLCRRYKAKYTIPLGVGATFTTGR